MKIYLLSFVFFNIIFISCQKKGFFKAKGTLLNESININLDSIEAKKYLEGDVKVITQLSKFNEYSLDNSLFRKIVSKYSIDLANLYLLKRVYSSSNHSIALDQYKKYLTILKGNDKVRINELVGRLANFHILFIPGLAYKLDTTTGADFSKQRKLLDSFRISNELIQTDELGFSDDNAKIIKNVVKSYNKNKKIILVSASKGGLETAIYLGNLKDKKEISKIYSWINVGGILKGTIISEEHCKFPKSVIPITLLNLKGKTSELIGDIHYNKRSISYNTLKFPKKIKIIHFQGLPFLAQVQPKIKDNYSILAKYGPNDGLTTITDSISPKGNIIIEIGLDHYFMDSDIDKKSIALSLLATENVE